MEERRRRKHQAQTRALVVCRDYRRIFAATPGGRALLARLKQAVSVQDSPFAVLTGILKTSLDAPAGALTALKQAKRIGPRVDSRGDIVNCGLRIADCGS